MAAELSELRITAVRAEVDTRDQNVMMDSLRVRLADVERERDELRKDRDAGQKVSAKEREDEKEKRKQEMIADMMAKIDLVRDLPNRS